MFFKVNHYFDTKLNSNQKQMDVVVIPSNSNKDQNVMVIRYFGILKNND